MDTSNLRVIPVYHGRVNFATIVASVFREFQPDCIAIELPQDMQAMVIKAVQRLPVVSIVGFVERDFEMRLAGNPPENDQAGPTAVEIPITSLNSRYTFIPIHPADPMVECIRLGIENGKDIEFIDLVLDNYIAVDYDMPDDEAIESFSEFSVFQDLVSAYIPKNDRGSIDYDREICMASRLRDILETGRKVLFIVGFAHVARIQEFLENDTRVEAIDTFFHDQQQIFNVAPASSDLIINEIPYIEYIYELARTVRGSSEDTQLLVDRVAMAKFDFFKESEKNIMRQAEPTSNSQPESQDNDGESITKLSDDRWIQVLKRVTAIEIDAVATKSFTRKNALALLFEMTNLIYQEYYFRDPVPAAMSRAMMQYLRNWAIIREHLFPTLDQVALTALNFMNEEYASILLEFARMYPFVDATETYPTVYHDASNQFFGPGSIWFKNRQSSRRKSWIQLPIKHRPMERYPGEWRRAWDSNSLGLCSFPPEDKIEEDFFNQMRNKTIAILEEKHVKIHEFKDSLMDGVEFRETMRKKILGKLYVKEIIPVIGKAGGVVIVFDPDEEKHRYGNMITWWAEHNQESDMAFYATYPEENIIGPGIARIELGGLVSIFPAKRIPDIWSYFYEYRDELKKHEILLLAAIVFSDEKFLPYIANEAPSKRMEAIANEYNKIIMHIPLWKMSKESIDSVRFLHVLRSKSTRAYAKNYIFL
jgi:hypothetical protein